MPKINEGQFNIWKTAKEYDIPYCTLKTRIDQNKLSKRVLGRPVSLSNYDVDLVNYIKRLENTEFPPTSVDIRRLAFTFAVKNNLPAVFNEDKQIAGYDWFQNSMRRHPTLSIRKAERVSIARCLDREDVNQYFEFLLKICENNDFLTQSCTIYNIDESGLQLNNNPGKAIATKGAREVHHVTSAEKGKSITVITCSNVEGKCLSPYCILKGKKFAYIS